MRHASVAAVVLCLAVAVPDAARADARNVGLGVAGGIAWSGSKIDYRSATATAGTASEQIGTRPAWGFFVDIPLLPTFYISPAAMLYSMKYDDAGNTRPVTDLDLNFKFIVPISDLHLGAGLTAGLSAGLPSKPNGYVPHVGGLGYLSYNLVANLDAFLLLQYKRQMVENASAVDDIHAFVGGMFRF
jgi:hypothetical protein